ncbi:MAG TPA: serine/threonine-protein kinase [Myxococcaceae bacterium]|jgi:serine/threonine protein kinase
MDTPAPEVERELTVLPLGTKVGTWRVCGIQGQGTYGTVYRAVAQEREHAEPVALKLAVYPGDACFEREVELLSRIRHPSVPRLLDSGMWQAHPFVVMEWVEGEPLYTWAARRNPSSRQVLALLAQAAGALQAIHEVSAVHRDVKGDNILVRPSDGRLFLTDLGAGYFAGAARLTPPHFLPGTPEYRSPELWESTRYTGTKPTAATLARPGDDVFALGVTAYRLVTDMYPPLPLPDMKAGACWLPGGSGPPPPRQLNPRVDAQLNALILRMLSLNPMDRGSALELAEAMKRGVAHAGPTADAPLFQWETLRPSQWSEEERSEARFLGHRPLHRDRERVLKTGQADAERAQFERRQEQVKARAWLSWLAAAMALGLWPGKTGTEEQLTSEQPVSDAQRRREVSLGDTALSCQPEREKASTGEPIAQEMPQQPLPGQRRPDSKGRCPDRQLAINGGCWTKVDVTPEHCHGNVYLHQGGCYLPMFTRGRVPTSAPPER